MGPHTRNIFFGIFVRLQHVLFCQRVDRKLTFVTWSRDHTVHMYTLSFPTHHSFRSASQISPSSRFEREVGSEQPEGSNTKICLRKRVEVYLVVSSRKVGSVGTHRDLELYCAADETKVVVKKGGRRSCRYGFSSRRGS